MVEKGGCSPGNPNCQEDKRNWNNCVAWNETSSGKHDDWCRNDHGPEWSHVGQDGAGCSKGFGKGVCRRYVYKGPNCEDGNSEDPWAHGCNENVNIFPGLQSARKHYCNSDFGRARSQKCVDWCNANGGQCELRDRIAKCARHKVPDSECQPDRVQNIINTCSRLGISNTAGEQVGTYECSQSGIDTLMNDCKPYMPKYITNDSGCNVGGLESAKRQKQTDDNAEAARIQAEQLAEARRKEEEKNTAALVAAQKESDRKREAELKKVSEEQKKSREEAQKKTEQMLLSVINPDALPDNLKDRVAPKNDDKTMYIIIAVVICLLLCSSLIGSFFLLGGKED